MSRLSKQQARQPDAFVSWADKTAAFIEQKRRTLLALVIACLTLSLLWIAQQYYAQHQEQLAQKDLYQAQKLHTQLLEEAKKNQSEDEKKTSSLLGDSQITVPPNPKLEQAWQYVLDKWPRSQAAHQAAIYLADYHIKNKKHETALTVLQTRLPHTHKSHFFYGLLHLYTGSLLMHLKRYAEAEQEFQLVKKSQHQYLHSAATYRLALSLEKQKSTGSVATGAKADSPADALQLYKTLSESETSSFVKAQAQAQLRWLAYQSGQEAARAK